MRSDKVNQYTVRFYAGGIELFEKWLNDYAELGWSLAAVLTPNPGGAFHVVFEREAADAEPTT